MLLQPPFSSSLSIVAKAVILPSGYLTFFDTKPVETFKSATKEEETVAAVSVIGVCDGGGVVDAAVVEAEADAAGCCEGGGAGVLF